MNTKSISITFLGPTVVPILQFFHLAILGPIVDQSVISEWISRHFDWSTIFEIDTTPFVGPKFLHKAILGPVLRLARKFQTAF